MHNFLSHRILKIERYRSKNNSKGRKAQSAAWILQRAERQRWDDEVSWYKTQSNIQKWLPESIIEWGENCNDNTGKATKQESKILLCLTFANFHNIIILQSAMVEAMSKTWYFVVFDIAFCNFGENQHIGVKMV